ncbi:hypothetical protein [Mycolicibacterium sp. CBMA 226]|uniref:hypothetical protein n=1 Tax=Mycolicibacterium sp. CBMA 226 TaxID=2606611 RepID=UPI0012DE97BB|nr:hypothetical protein [Mycolicibacterium sp. CBMA 226]MUL77242.1 hypothetical protein [Mycolicibacterium sp. CBMA 226]
MTYGYSPPPPARPPISGGDLAASISALVLTYVGGGVAAFFAVFAMAFTDYCPPATCHIDAGINAMAAGFIAAIVVALAGTVVTVIRLVKRRPAWPFAVGTLGLCAVLCALAIGGYIAAVGG